jgi:hypothetical protein
MTNKPDQLAVEEDAGVVQEDAVAPKKAATAKKKAAPKRRAKATVGSKSTTAKSKRPRQAAKPVAPPPPPLTIKELKEQGAQAKQELVSAVIEPALEAAGSLSQTIRDTIGGAFAGLLSRKRRGD